MCGVKEGSRHVINVTYVIFRFSVCLKVYLLLECLCICVGVLYNSNIQDREYKDCMTFEKEEDAVIFSIILY